MDSGIVTIVITFTGGVVSYFIGVSRERSKAKKTDAETDGVNLNNVNTAILIWEQLTKKLKDELDSVRGEVSKLREENKKLHGEVIILREENKILHGEVEKLRGLISNK